MHKITLFLLLAVLCAVASVNTVFGRKCWYCKNARGNEECLRNGRLEQCLPNQKFCQNEIRAIGGGRYFEITKRCKQTNACSNNKMQNFTGSYPFQCDSEEPHSVCRCCCGFDNCNGPEVSCLPGPLSCDPPRRPINGMITCPPRLFAGATCYYRCNTGYKLFGEYTTECISSGRDLFWSNDPPRCETVPCRALEPPENGEISCSNEWNIGSECTFSCEPGRVLVGSEVLKCSVFSKWDEEEPTCRVVTCTAPRPLDPNFVPPGGECSDEYNYGSTCNFTCHPDYDLVGENLITCGPPVNRNNRATWNNRPPTCRKKVCRPNYCGTNEVGDSCTFDCERCESLVGNRVIECTRNGWTGEPGQCVIITCQEPPDAPENGAVQCTSSANQCDDFCTYSCNSGYRLVGNPRITCLASGSWSGPAPICELSECDPIDLPGITSRCSEGFAVGSQCALSCNQANSEMIGINQVTCKKDESDPVPVWDPPLTQYCRPLLCPNFPRPGESPDPDAGSLSCGLPSQRVLNDRDGREGWRIGAQCNLECNEGYRAKDLLTSTDCVRASTSATWTASVLCCVACLPNTLLDVVVFLDATEPALWEQRILFLEGLTKYMVFDNGFELNITFIPFADEVKYSERVRFLTFDDDQNIQDVDYIRRAFEANPPTFSSNEDSNSGRALQEAADNIFGFHDFRMPIIFLITTKPPSDLDSARRAVQELQDRGIHLRIFPVTARTTADPGGNRDLFLDLVEDEKYLLDDSVDEGSLDLFILANEDLVTVTKVFCNAKTQSLQDCEFAR